LGLSACKEDATQTDSVTQHEANDTAKAARSQSAADGLLSSSPQSYLEQAQQVRQSLDRPWAPVEGRLGNLRHVQITAQDCVVRVVSGVLFDRRSLAHAGHATLIWWSAHQLLKSRLRGAHPGVVGTALSARLEHQQVAPPSPAKPSPNMGESASARAKAQTRKIFDATIAPC